MMKLRSDDLIVLGLSEENIKRLKDGKPILFKGSDVLVSGVNFLIVYGKTEQQMEQDLITAGFRIPQ